MLIKRIDFDSPAPEGAVEALAALLEEAVNDGASLGYLHGAEPKAYLDFWNGEIEEAIAGKGCIFYAEVDGEIAGVVQLAYALKQTARHRAEVRKLLVRKANRGVGIATELMKALEDYAMAQGRTLLYLDTEKGSDADYLYPKLGWNLYGVIPNYAASPNGELADCSFYWKSLI